jgi:hypothetical protein
MKNQLILKMILWWDVAVDAEIVSYTTGGVVHGIESASVTMWA